MKKYILCLIMLLMLCSCGKNNSDITIKGSETFTTVDNGISAKVDKFYYQDKNSTMNLIIKNNNDYDVYIGKYAVLVYDKEDNLIGAFEPQFNGILEKGKETNQMFSIEEDYTKAYKLDYVFDDVKENTNN